MAVQVTYTVYGKVEGKSVKVWMMGGHVALEVVLMIFPSPEA